MQAPHSKGGDGGQQVRMWKDFAVPGVANGVGGGVPEERCRVGGVPGQPVAGVPPKDVLGVCFILGVCMSGVRGDMTSALVANASGRLVISAAGRLARGRAGLIGLWTFASSRNWIIASCSGPFAGVMGTGNGCRAHRSGHHSG